MEHLSVCTESGVVQSFQLFPNGLVVDGSPSIKEWLQIGKTLKRCQGATQWWIGDWLNYGEQHYGEMYAQALEETDFKYGYLRNIKYVASKVKLSHRCDNLGWRHHQLIAPLPPEEQKKWLEKASKGNSEKPWSIATLREAIKRSKNPDRIEWVKRTDVWNIPACDDRFGIDFPGRIPGQIVLNLLYYYTKEGDLIVDPMAGGGVTIDAAQEMKRRCIAFDILPAREDIAQHDATEPWPLNERVQLVFIDPPYWSQMESDYGGMASLPYSQYLDEMNLVFTHSFDTLEPGGAVAVLIAPMAIKSDFIDVPFDFVQVCRDIGFKYVRRIIVPVSSQQIGPRVMEHCRDNDIMAALARDLLIFRRPSIA